MSVIEVSAKTTTKDEAGKTTDLGPVSVKVDLGDTLEQFVTYCSRGDADGKKVALSNGQANVKISIQDVIRASLKNGDKPAETQKKVDAWSPGVKKRGRTKAEKFRDEFDQMSSDDRKNLLARLTADNAE